MAFTSFPLLSCFIIKERFFLTRLQFVQLVLHWKQIKHPPGRSLKILSGISSWIHDKVEYLEEVKQLNALMPLITLAKMLRISKQRFFKMISIGNVRGHYILVFALSPMQDVSKKCQCPEPVAGPLRPDRLQFQSTTLRKSLNWDNECFRLQLTKWALQNIQNGQRRSPVKIYLYQFNQVPVRWFNPFALCFISS